MLSIVRNTTTTSLRCAFTRTAIRSYHENILDHYENPRNVGSLDKLSKNVGTGLVGAPACGDVMKLQFEVNAEGIITDAKFKTFGCGSAIASSSVATEWLKGRKVDDCLSIKVQQQLFYCTRFSFMTTHRLAMSICALVFMFVSACLATEHGHRRALEASTREIALQHVGGGRHQVRHPGLQGQERQRLNISAGQQVAAGVGSFDSRNKHHHCIISLIQSFFQLQLNLASGIG